jgi:hypothetical protein
MISQVTPLILSPTSSVSTPSTPGTGCVVWDTPETPLRQSSIQGDFNLSTPLTPPVASDDLGQTCEPQAKPNLLPVADHIPPTQITTPDLDSGLKNRQSARTSRVSDAVDPGELFRNCKDALLASKENPG